MPPLGRVLTIALVRGFALPEEYLSSSRSRPDVPARTILSPITRGIPDTIAPAVDLNA